MAEDTDKPRRVVTVRRNLTLGAMAAAMAGSAVHAAAVTPMTADTPGWHQKAAGEGEGEGEGEGGAAAMDPDVRFLRDLSFIEGHLRAGLALYRAGDLTAAKTHMGHPIKEKYDAVAERVQAEGRGELKAQIVALADAAEAGKDAAEVAAQFDLVKVMIDEMRGASAPKKQIMGLIALTRIAGDEYTVATEGGSISNLHEYQDSWGFMQVVADEVDALAASGDATVAGVADKLKGYVAATDAVFGDLQGQGDFTLDSGVLYGAAARMELAAARLK